MATVQPVRGSSLTGRFVAGVAVGMLSAIAGFVALFAALIMARVALGDPPDPQTALVSIGANISRGGGVGVEVDQWTTVVRQGCRGVCDDLWLTGEDFRAVRIVDSRGACVACREEGRFLTRQPQSLAAAGRPVFKIVADPR